jgi:very-short-patch-repair endonuclease
MRWRRIAEEQYGVIHREQLAAAGLTPAEIRTRIARGDLVSILPSTYLLGGAPQTWEARLMGGELWAGDCFISHRSAAALWNLDGFDHIRVVELSAYSAKRNPRVILHRLRAEDRPALRMIGGFRVSAPERTLLDLAGSSSRETVAGALEDALRRRITTLDRLWETWELDGGPGRKGTSGLRDLLAARDHRSDRLRSRLESKMLALLTSVQSEGLEADYRVSCGGTIYFLDFAYPAFNLAIETLGLRWHFGEEKLKKDLARDRRLSAIGWEVLYYTWDDVHHNPNAVTAEIAAFLRKRQQTARM